MIHPVTVRQVETLLYEAGFLKSYIVGKSLRNSFVYPMTGFEVEESIHFGQVIVYHNLGKDIPLYSIKPLRTRALVAYARLLKAQKVITYPGYTVDGKHLWYLRCDGFEMEEVTELAQLVPGARLELDGASWSGYTPVFIRYESQGDWVVVGLKNQRGYQEYRIKFNKILRILPPGVE